MKFWSKAVFLETLEFFPQIVAGLMFAGMFLVLIGTILWLLFIHAPWVLVILVITFVVSYGVLYRINHRHLERGNVGKDS